MVYRASPRTARATQGISGERDTHRDREEGRKGRRKRKATGKGTKVMGPLGSSELGRKLEKWMRIQGRGPSLWMPKCRLTGVNKACTAVFLHSGG